MAEKEIYYEMLWDCKQCSTRGLLGDSHRHCPTCGSAQDPTTRYFPTPGEEVQAQDHEFVGVDWRCAFCTSPNSAAAAFCTNCGGGKDGTKPVSIVSDAHGAATEPPSLQAAPRAPRWWLWALGAAVLLVVALVSLLSTTHDTTATVAQRSWSREIQIEQLARVPDSAWCDSLPSDAYGVSRSREQRSTRQIPDGQTCHEQRIDKGDGTFVKRQECTPRYRQEPVFDNRCHYQVNRWRSVRTAKASTQNSLLPAWPQLGQLGGNFLGATPGALGTEREGQRQEKYELTLQSKGKTWTCVVPQDVWDKYEEGSTTTVQVRLSGGANCASLH